MRKTFSFGIVDYYFFLNLCFLSTSYIAPRNICVVQLVFHSLRGKMKRWCEQALLSVVRCKPLLLNEELVKSLYHLH